MRDYVQCEISYYAGFRTMRDFEFAGFCIMRDFDNAGFCLRDFDLRDYVTRDFVPDPNKQMTCDIITQ